MAETKRPQAWVTTVAPEEADGALKEAYDWQAKRLGEPTEFYQHKSAAVMRHGMIGVDGDRLVVAR